MEPEEFDIQSLRDTRNLKAKGISNKSNNAQDVARRTRQSEKRAQQARMNQVQQVEPQPELKQTSKYSNGKAKRQKPKDQPFVQINEQLGRPAKKMQRNMRRQ